MIRFDSPKAPKPAFTLELHVQQPIHRLVLATLRLGLLLALIGWAGRSDGQPAAVATQAVQTLPGMPRVVDPTNLYSETAAGRFSPAVAGALSRVYVPNLTSNDVYVIDAATFKVVDRFPVGVRPQHIIPSWDLKTLWVANNGRKHFREGA
jgi:40-residue YVTN family beta-propeller repeat